VLGCWSSTSINSREELPCQQELPFPSNMTRVIQALSIFITVLAAELTSVSAINWKLSSSSCDGSPFSSLKVAVTCNGGSSSCGLGDTATVAGTLTATDYFDNSDVTLHACVVGYCPGIAKRGGGKICDDWLTPVGDQAECGDPGKYAIGHTEEIPDENDIPSGFWWFVKSTVTVNMKVGGEEECGAKAANAYSMMSYSMAGMASLAMIGAAAYAARKIRYSADRSDDDQTSVFVEMGDAALV